jgi:hypothetical protein
MKISVAASDPFLRSNKTGRRPESSGYIVIKLTIRRKHAVVFAPFVIMTVAGDNGTIYQEFFN